MKRFKKTLLFVSHLLIGSFLSISGCDYLPEVITGRPNPLASKIQPAGPSAISPSLSPITTQTSSPLHEGPATFVHETNPVIKTSGSELGISVPPSMVESRSNVNQAIAYTGASDTGIYVPPADTSSASTRTSSQVSTDGRIVIRNANLKFVNDLEIAAQADGLIIKLDADEGDLLKTGSLLVQLDDRLANSELEVTRKELEAAQEKAKDDSEIQYSRAAYNVAEIDYTKTEELNSRGSETDAELRKKWLEKRRAELAITVAQVKNNQDKAAVSVSTAKRGASEVQVDLRKMLAPFDGIVAEKKKEKYDWVRSGEVLLRLVSMEQIRVVGQVRVEDLQAPPHQLLGTTATVDIELFPGHRERVTGKIGFVSPVMEVSGGYRVWLQVPNVKADGQWLFREGMPASIEITTR